MFTVCVKQASFVSKVQSAVVWLFAFWWLADLIFEPGVVGGGDAFMLLFAVLSAGAGAVVAHVLAFVREVEPTEYVIQLDLPKGPALQVVPEAVSVG